MTGLQQVVVGTLSEKGATGLTDQIISWTRDRIDQRLYRPGMRMPSIRRFAADNNVSRFTVVEAYDRLVAQGYLESRRGSGFYVRDRAQRAFSAARDAGLQDDRPATPIDTVWLVRSMFASAPTGIMPGSGCLPAEWLDGDMVDRALRTMARRGETQALAYGTPEGYLPLRQQLQIHLSDHEIQAQPNQIVLTAGASQALDLVARHFLKPGDAVLVDDPGYYVLFGRLAAMGARMIGVPRNADGPDLAHLEAMIVEHRPKLYITHSVLHNPTGTSISAANAYRMLQLAETHDLMLVEDDVYSDLHPGSANRIAALDQLRRVIYIGSFSKTLGAGLRVGFLACRKELAQALADEKMLTSLTTPELGERLVYLVLSDGHYRKHVERLRDRLSTAIERTINNLERAGFEVFHQPSGGMFVWARSTSLPDANALAIRGHEQGVILAPGSLFSPSQAASPWLRFSVAATNHPRTMRFLEALR